MSKVICDVCGTTFPETANQCPICGSAKNASAQTAAEGGAQAEAGSTHSPVSGGRFSKSNVRKRNKANQPAQRRNREAARKNDDGEGSNKGLVIVVIVLLLAIIAVFAYLAISWFGPDKDADKDKNKNPSVQTTGQTQNKNEDPTPSQTRPSGVACTDVVLSSTIIEFTDADRSQLLSVNLTPSNTTDKVTFTSLNPAVATVTDGGLVTPVGIGDTTIVVTCGDITRECRVFCNFGNAGTEPDPGPGPDTDPDPDPNPGAFEMTMNTKYFTSEGVGDVTLSVGATWRMYSTISVEASKVVWTSEDEAYVTIKDGVVTTVASTESLAKKYVLVHAEYGGVTYSCRIRVNGGASTPSTPPATPPAAEPTPPATGTVELMNRVDFTLQKVGDTWNVYKNTEISQTVAATDIVWVSEDPNVVTVVDGVVTAVGTGNTYIHAEYNGQTATCKVIVK